MHADLVTDPRFLQALLGSASFYRSVVIHTLLALLLVVTGAWLLGRGWRWRRLARLHADRGGVAMAVDAVLTLPIFLAMVMLAIQFMLLANAALITHYAAFSAARSARVWFNEANADYHWRTSLEAERAARLALVAASPANPRVPVRRPLPFPESLFRGMAVASGYPGRQGVFLRKARYAFDRDNVAVNLAPVDLPSGIIPRRVHARVSFQVYLNVPFGWVLGTDRGDGVHTRAVVAEMVVL